MEYHSAVKHKIIMNFYAGKWKELEKITLSEVVIQIQKEKSPVFFLICDP